MPEVQRYRNGEDEKFCKLFIGGLNYSTTEEGLKSHFEQWGEIVDCVVMRDLTTKRSRGFGFVTYKTEDMLDEAQKHRPHKVDNREVDTKRAIPRSEADESQAAVKKMFVGGLKEGTTEDEIKERFESYGTIEKIELIKDKATGKQRGFCFVTYNDPDAVDKCVLRKRIQLNGKVVEVKKAVSKTEIERSGRGGMRGGSDYGMRDNFDDNYGGGGNWNMGGENNWGNSGGYPNQGGGGWNQGGQGVEIMVMMETIGITPPILELAMEGVAILAQCVVATTLSDQVDLMEVAMELVVVVVVVVWVITDGNFIISYHYNLGMVKCGTDSSKHLLYQNADQLEYLLLTC
ncbi:heterogeneous nuclear ribonucleoprotein A1, A2 B1 homolog [Octopus vulgaris]|uniref:Heterogeneous nuclear ribonucleoprotein A1, A2 B1 homolog n=1 Tax=Octopus vulgaris TaxID=6645 RepID=A0AA36B0F6_OCTVU|nr:heterogeneous nuclear ribonucleoprotein A1, A2 B1 homolog [Octopus vulgaris]